MPASKTSAVIVARGTANAAFTQLTGCSVTRTGTTATLTKTAHGLATSDKVLVQSFELEEFNGVFTITVVDANTFTYTIKQDPGANPASAVGTVDKVTLGTAVDLSSAYACTIAGEIQNRNTGPTIAPQVWIGQAEIASPAEADWRWRLLLEGSTSANGFTSFVLNIPPGQRNVNLLIGRNTGQPVDFDVSATYLTA